MYKFNVENTETKSVSRIYPLELRIVWKLMLKQLVFDYSEGKVRAEYWSVEGAEQIGNSSYMILVSVGEKYTPQLFSVLLDI